MAYYTDDAMQLTTAGTPYPVQAAGIPSHAIAAAESPVNPIIARAFAMNAAVNEAY